MSSLSFEPKHWRQRPDGAWERCDPVFGTSGVLFAGRSATDPNQAARLDEMRRIIQEGGSIFVIDPKGDSSLAKSIIVSDEWGQAFGKSDDWLREELRSIEGVPTVEYLVEDNKVFVFERLVEQVKGVIGSAKEDRIERIKALVPTCWTAPDHAVLGWHIVPRPYEVHRTATDGGAAVPARWDAHGDDVDPNEVGDFQIVHTAFGAAIPRRFTTRAEVNRALSLLLIGGVVHGEDGCATDFVYRGQPFRLLAPFDVDAIPERPALPMTPSLDVINKPPSIAFPEDFAPLSRAGFELLNHAWEEWRAVRDQLAARAALTKESIRDRASALIGTNESSEGAEGEETEPEFTRYGHDVRIYRLGLLAVEGHPVPDEDEVAELGAIMGLALLDGATDQVAREIAKAWRAYGQVISRLYTRAERARVFLEEDRQRRVSAYGAEVRTMAGLFNLARSGNLVLMPAPQHAGGSITS